MVDVEKVEEVEEAQDVPGEEGGGPNMAQMVSAQAAASTGVLKPPSV